MADDWKLCADWLVRCKILAPEHPAAKPTGQLQNLAAVLHDGVLICMLLNRLHPGAIDSEDFVPYPQVSLVQSQLCVTCLIIGIYCNLLKSILICQSLFLFSTCLQQIMYEL